MRIKDKIYLDSEGLRKEGPITIVAFGDSVTHGAVALDEIDYESVYWNRLRNKILGIRNYVPVNVINAGIGGITAAGSLDRIDSQVLIHKPDLVIVCFGLNDINCTIDEYLSSLKVIFEKCKRSGSDVIFMTPNMLNTYVAEDTPEKFLDYAAFTAEFQNSGKMDTYIYAAVNVAKKIDVPLNNKNMLVKTENGFTIKRIKVVDGKIELHYLNPSGKKITPKEVKIIGKVVGTYNLF